MLLNCGVGEDSWESLGLQGDPTSPSQRRSVLGVHWKHWCWSWNSNPLATWCEELTHLKRPWCWEGLGAGGEGDDRGWDGWMASPTQWTWFWVDFGSWWWTGRPGMLRFMRSQRVGHDWVTELTGWHRPVFLRQPAGPPQRNSAGDLDSGSRSICCDMWWDWNHPQEDWFSDWEKKAICFYKATPTKWSRKFQTMRHGKKLHTEEESSHSWIRMCTKMLAGTMIVMATNQIPLCSRKENKRRERIGMGNTCKSMANSCQCMTKTTTIL